MKRISETLDVTERRDGSKREDVPYKVESTAWRSNSNKLQSDMAEASHRPPCSWLPPRTMNDGRQASVFAVQSWLGKPWRMFPGRE